MRRSFLLLPFALAACHSPGSAGGTANASSVDTPADQGPFLTPGHWTTTKTFKDVAGGSPDSMADKRQLLSKMAPETAEFCLTPELARRPPANFFIGNDQLACDYDNLDHAGSKVTAKLTCHIPAINETDQVVTTGAFDAGSAHLEANVTQSLGNLPPDGSLIMTLEAKNTGPCTGHEGQP